MSTEKTAPRAASKELLKTKVGPDVERKPVAVQSIDVSELQIDETFDGDFDPYNSTGQFLADAIKKKYDDQ